jgi:hypothetical protein
VNLSPEFRSVYKLTAGTLKTSSSSTCVTAIHFFAYQIWITNKLFKQIFCTLMCVHIFYARLRHYATSRKVAGSIPNEAIGFSN